MPLLLNWAKVWLWPAWLSPGQVLGMFAVWLAALVVSLVVLRNNVAGCLLWVVFAAQWCALFRPEAWSIGILGAILTGWLITVRKAWALLIAMLISLMIILLAAYERMYGSLTPDAVAAVLQTNAGEAGGFVIQYMSQSVLAMLLLLPLTHVVLFWMKPQVQVNRLRAALPFALVVVLFGSAGQLDRFDSVRKAIASTRAQELALAKPMPGMFSIGDSKPLDVVLILGESSSRWHWQLYGYPGQTNPRLSRMRGQFLQFEDVISADSHTVLSLGEMFYRPLATPGAQVEKKTSLVDVLNAADVDTVWLSAQAKFGPWAAPVSRLAKDSRRAVFFEQGGLEVGTQQGAANPDMQAKDAVLRELGKPAGHPKRLIVEHMMAAHAPYCSHVLPGDDYKLPVAGAAYFGTAADLSSDLACYDKAIRFTDSIVADVIGAAAARPRPTVVIFVPDHGEAPEEGTGHNNAVHSARHVEIPMLIHFNAAARTMYADAYQGLSFNTKKPFLNRWLNELLMDLMDVASAGVRREIDSPLSASFNPPPREILRSGNAIHYDQLSVADSKDVLELTRLNLKRISETPGWNRPLYAHRIDTVAEALEAKQYFSGIEMDVTFDESDGRFTVCSPCAGSPGPTLDEQFQALADRPQLQLWLDFQRAHASSEAARLLRLDDLDRNWKLKRRTVLELPAAAAIGTMRAYTDGGWQTAYRLPADLARCTDQRNAADCEKEAGQVIDAALAGGVSYLSFDHQLFPAVERYIAPRKKSLKLFAKASVESSDFGLPGTLASLPRFDGVAIPLKSKFSR